MSAFLARFRLLLDLALLAVCALILTVLVVAVSWQVFSRYVLNDPSSSTDELSRFLMVWLGLLGASYLFGKNKHLAITLLVDSLHGWSRRMLEIFIHLLTIAFVATAMLKGGIALMGRTMQQFSPSLDLPMGWVYFVLPLAACLICIYSLLNIVDVCACRHDTTADHDFPST